MIGSAPGTSESPWVPEFTDGQYDLSLALPDTRLIDAADQRSCNPLGEVVSLNKRSLWKNLVAAKGLVITFLVWLIFTILYSLFVYYVLLKGKVQVGTARFDASTANLLVSIFSQIFVILADTSIRGLLSALGLALALNRGTGLTLFLGVSPSTDWFPILKLFVLAWLPNLWGRWTYAIWANGSLLGFRLSLPIIGLAFASGLKFQATFDYCFVPGSTQVDVYAGLMPLHNNILSYVPVATLCLYFQGQTSSLLANNKYATSFSLDDCEDGCTSFVLPGGIETARHYKPFLNETLLDGSIQDIDSGVMKIIEAPGFVLKFENVEDSFSFNLSNDCVYAGQSFKDSLMVCARQVNESIAFGWAACPDQLEETNSCNTSTKWTNETREWATIMTVYTQFATTVYDRRNFSIIDVQTTVDKEIMFLNASDYLTIFNKIFIPAANSSDVDKAGIVSLINSLTWLHRTYLTYFQKDQNSIISSLRNLLAVPFQFTVTAVQYGNYTYDNQALGFNMSNNMRTTAVTGLSAQKLVILPWTGWTFIAASAFLLLVAFIGICWIVALPNPLPDLTGFGDLDTALLGDKISIVKQVKSTNSENGFEEERMTLTTFAAVNYKHARSFPRRIGSWRVVPNRE